MTTRASPPPSQGRRQALRNADKSNVLLVIDTYPIDKYYAVMNRLVKEFDAAVDARKLDQAYIYGIRYASFSLESLPKHREYKRSFSRKKAAQVEQVLAKLESVTERMDAEELRRQHRELQARRDAEEAKQHEEQEQRDRKAAKYKQMMNKLGREQIEAKQQQKQQSSRKAKQSSTKQSALAKLQALQQQSDMLLKAKEEKKAEEPAAVVPVRSARAKGEMEKEEARQDEERKRVEQHQQELQRQRDDRTLQKERQRLADQAERLAQHQREEKAKQEEWETMKFLFHEAAEGERQDTEAAAPAVKVEERGWAARQAQQAREAQQKEAEIQLTQAAEAKNKEEKSKRAKAAKPIQAQAQITTGQLKVKQAQARTTMSKEIPTTPKMQPTIAVLPIEQKDGAVSSSPYQPKGMRPEEKRTIRILEDTIVKQEQNLQDLEEKNIPALLVIARMKLASGNRREALFCMARKKKLDAAAEGLKSAIFTMETQILMLESAVENRQVEKAMRAAADAMESLQGGVDVSSIHDANQVVHKFSESVVDDTDFDEEELMRELELSSTTTEANADAPEHASILSLPTVPIEELPEVETASTKKPAGFLAN